jgi:DNA-binding CsgD family transcriptional regulator
VILLERSTFLETFAGFLREASAGRGALVFLGGEAGVGKTALVEAFCLTAQRTARVALGACDSLSAPRPLGPLVDAAGALGLEGTMGRETARTEVFRALLARLSVGSSPTLLVFEDVHWADEATLDVLRFLGRRVGGTRALVIATYRDDETGPSHPLRVLLGDLATAASVRRVALPPLSEGAVAVLADGSGLDPKALFKQTAGNPFFVTEIVSSGLAGIPPTVRDAVLARAARLSARARSVLDAAAVIGSRFEADVLTGVMGSDAEALEEGLSLGVLRADGALIAFRHELGRQSLLEALSPPRALDLHRRVLAALRALPPDPDRLARLAHHAEAAGDGAAVLEYAPEAARLAARLHAHREAAAQYARAIRFSKPLDPLEKARLLVAYADEAAHVDQAARGIEAREEAIAIFRERGEQVREGAQLALLAVGLIRSGRNADAEAASLTSIQILEALPPGPALASAYATQTALRMLNRDANESLVWGEKSLVLARAHGSEIDEACALNSMGTVMLLAGNERGRDYLEASIQQSQAVGFDNGVALGYANLGSGLGECYRLEDAQRCLDAGISFSDEHDLDQIRGYMVAWRALARLHLGCWTEAALDARSVVNRATSMTIARIMALVALGRLRARRGDPEVWAALDEALELAAPTGQLQRLGPVRAARAEAAWLEGHPERALEEARAAYDLALEHAHPWFVGELAYWRWKLGDLKEPPEGVARPFALQIGGQCLEAAEAWRGLNCPYEAARALSESDDEAALKHALAELERLGARPMAQWVSRRLRDLGIKGIPRGPRPSTKTNRAGLTHRELEVLHLLTEGQRDKQIARGLHLSEKTVGHHVSAILAKLGKKSRAEAVHEALRLGIPSPN